MQDLGLDGLVAHVVRAYPRSGCFCEWNDGAKAVIRDRGLAPPLALQYASELTCQEGEALAERIRKACQVLAAMQVETGATHAG